MILHAIAKVHDWRNQSHTVDILTASQNSAKTKKLGVILNHSCSSSLKDPDMTVDAQPPPWQQIVDKKVLHKLLQAQLSKGWKAHLFNREDQRVVVWNDRSVLEFRLLFALFRFSESLKQRK